VRDILPPVADAGPDRTVDEDTLVTFDGSGSSDNVGVVNFTWTINSFYIVHNVMYGPSPSFTFNQPLVYQIILRVTDAAGNWHEDDMNLTVNDVTPPVAVAGSDMIIPAMSFFSLNGSLSTDNVGIASYCWTITHGLERETYVQEWLHDSFREGGVYEVVLIVADGAGNVGKDTIVITVVDTGRVYGTVLDEKGRPVEGAKVELTRSNGTTCSTTTGANGSFALDIFHGNFNWSISKEGYRIISGRAAVKPMDEVEIELSNFPLVKEADNGPPILLFVMPVVVVLLVVIVVALFFLKRRKGESEG
jgi:hypothetical protein